MAVASIRSGLIVCLAHADYFGIAEDTWTTDCERAARAICRAARQEGVPLELNGRGLRDGMIACSDGTERHRYPWRPFWEIAAEEDAPVAIGSDAHKPSELLAGYDDLRIMMDELELRQVDLAGLIESRHISACRSRRGVANDARHGRRAAPGPAAARR